MRLLVSLDQVAIMCRVANVLQTAYITDHIVIADYTVEVAHHAAGHSGVAITGDHRGVTTAVHRATSRTEMAKKNIMLKG